MAVDPCIIHTWAYPDDDSHVFWDNSSVVPQLRKFVTTSEGLLTGATTAAADAISELQTMITDRVAGGNTSQFYSMYVHKFSDLDNMRGLENPYDGISNWISQGSFDGVTNSTPFISNGLDVCKAWGDVFLDEFKSLLDENELPYPSRFHFDTETGIDKSYATRPSSSGYDGWMDFALADPRASTELVDGISTFEGLVNGWTTVDGGTLGWDVNTSYWDETNRNLRDFLNHYEWKVRDYLHWYGFISYATSLFPNTPWSNWNHGNYGTYDEPTICRSKASNRCFNDSAPYSDFAAPAAYPLRNESFQDTGSSKGDWIQVLGLTGSVSLHGPPYDDEYETVWTNRAIQTVEGLVQFEGASRTMPWINYAGEYYTETNFRDGTTVLTIGATDAQYASVGNSMFLFNSVGVKVFNSSILRIYDQDDGTYTINVPELDESNFASVAVGRDVTIGVDFDIDNIEQEPAAYFYQTRQRAIDTILARFVALDIREYFFWQNGDTITDAQWISMADGVSKVEDGLGVLLGELKTLYVNTEGSKIHMGFQMPANGAWNISNLSISQGLAPTFTSNDEALSYIQITTSALSVNEVGDLCIDINLTSNNLISTDDVEATVYENWISDNTYRFKTSATTNVVSGFGSNPTSATYEVSNESEERNSRNNGKTGDSSDRIPPFDISPGVVPY